MSAARKLIRHVQLWWARFCLQCIAEELAEFDAAGITPGPQYRRNAADMSRDLRSRIAVLECGILINHRSSQ